MSEVCCYHNDYDPIDDTPRGNKCGAPAVQAIVWKDGRVSPACKDHGLDAIDPEVHRLIADVRPVEEYWPPLTREQARAKAMAGVEPARIHFRCPNCGAEHWRGYFGHHSFRCLACGYQGHGLHPDHDTDEDLYQQWLADNAYNRSVGAEEVPLGVDPKDFAS